MSEGSKLTASQLRVKLLDKAREFVTKGPPFAQEGHVLHVVMEELGMWALNEQQRLLSIWSDLFREGTLVRGYNIEYWNSPYYHVT